MSKVIGFDTETEYSKEYSVRTLGAAKYTSDSRFNCYLVTVCDGQETWAGHPSKLNWSALEGATLVSHNAGFDQAVYTGMVKRGQAPAELVTKAWHCTADLAAYCTSRRALADAVKFLYGVDVSKEARNYMCGRTFADAEREGRANELIEYARRDAYWTWKIWTDHSSKWPEHERELSRLNRESGVRGVRIDTEKLKTFIHACQQELIYIELTLPWKDSGRKPTSPLALAEECAKHGIPSPPVKSDDEEGFIEWETKYSPRYPWINAVSNWRSVNKVLKTLLTIKARLREDDTIEAPLRYFGAHTGRYSGDSGLNFQNFRKDALRANGVDVYVRHLIIPRPGSKMITCDLAQIEPRVLNWLAGNAPMMESMRNGFSYYEAYAKLYKNYSDWSGEPGTIKKYLGDEKYTLLKNEALGLGYGMGVDRYIEYAHVTQEEAQAVIANFRERSTYVTKLWEKLDGAFKRSCGGTFEMELPSGRTLTYRNVKRGLRIKVDKDGKLKKESAVYAEVGERRVAMWGGFLTENITQAVARDVFCSHLLELNRRGFRILFTCHDEAILEVEPDVTAKDVQEIMSQTPEWLPGCPIAAEAKEVPCYRK